MSILLGANGKSVGGHGPAWSTTLAGYDIVVEYTGKATFSVRYGAHTRRGLGYEEAATALGTAIFHALACEGKFNGEH